MDLVETWRRFLRHRGSSARRERILRSGHDQSPREFVESGTAASEGAISRSILSGAVVWIATRTHRRAGRR
jgi:hypothetical protein